MTASCLLPDGFERARTASLAPLALSLHRIFCPLPASSTAHLGGLPSDNSDVHVRFHAPDAERPGDVVSLPPEEAHHLARVLRVKAGAVVRVFNGRGDEFDGTVEHAGRTVRVRVGSPRVAAPEPRVAVTLAQAVLKSDKMDAVVRDAVMMGVAAIQPMITARSEVTLQALLRGHRRQRWERICVSSAKQCGRAVVPRVLEPRLFETVVTALSGMTPPGPGLMFVEPAVGAHAVASSSLDGSVPREATVLVGPEGGWTPEEIEYASPMVRYLALGGRTLRADTMAIVAVTALFTRWGEL
jgi:16S rRNA (uracil1498-N3)-methyltransferase